MEGKTLWADDENREWVKKVSFDNFWDRIEQAGDVIIQIEGFPKKEEGQAKPSTEGAPSGYTGGEIKG